MADLVHDWLFAQQFNPFNVLLCHWVIWWLIVLFSHILCHWLSFSFATDSHIMLLTCFFYFAADSHIMPHWLNFILSLNYICHWLTYVTDSLFSYCSWLTFYATNSVSFWTDLYIVSLIDCFLFAFVCISPTDLVLFYHWLTIQFQLINDSTDSVLSYQWLT